MNFLHSHSCKLTLITLGWLLGFPAIINAAVLVTPDALIVTGVRGETGREVRNLTVRSTETVRNLKVYAFDLYNADRDRTFAKQLITLPEAIAGVEANTLENLPVEFNLQSAHSGEFQGNLLLSYQDNEVLVPVTVRMKDPWYLPLAVLVLGVILGTTVSSYSRWGRTTDEITLSLENLRTQRESDRALPRSFASRLDTHLLDAKLARDGKQLEAAREAIAAAKVLWGKWMRQRPAWLNAWAMGTDLQESLAQLPLSDLHSRYLQTLQRTLQATLDRGTDFADAPALEHQIHRLAQQQALYLRVHHQLRELQQLVQESQPGWATTERSEWVNLQTQVLNLEQQLQNLLPSEQADEPDLFMIEMEIRRPLERLNQLKQQAQPQDLAEFQLGQDKSGENQLPIPALPAATVAVPYNLSTFEADENPVLHLITKLLPGANQRLQLFSLVGYLVAIAFLAGTGFNQLYLERPTFGANGLRDYFSLLAWGFGAEATRSAVTTVLRRTDESKS